MAGGGIRRSAGSIRRQSFREREFMPTSTDSGPLALDRPDDVRRVRDALDRAGYDYEHVSDRIATRRSIKLSPGPCDRPGLLRRTRDGDPQATLIRLFLLGVPVSLEAFRTGQDGADGPAALGGDLAWSISTPTRICTAGSCSRRSGSSS